jgi:hypothetical protein
MRYNQLLALPFAAGLMIGASGLAMAATANVAAVEPVKLGFVAASVAPTAAPSLARLAMDDSRDKNGERDRGDYQRDHQDRQDRQDRSRR